MQQALRRYCLVPPGFAVESAVYEAERTVITVRPIKSFGSCPSCGAASRCVHSHYRRRVADLPLAGRSVQLVLVAQRFRCADSDEVARAFRDDVARCSDMMSPGVRRLAGG